MKEIKELVGEAIEKLAYQLVAIEGHCGQEISGAKLVFEHSDGREFKIVIMVNRPDDGGDSVH